VCPNPNRSVKGPGWTTRRGVILRSQSGQALLEAALVTPLLLALLVGTIELGRYAYIGILVGNAARAGAAYGAQGLARSADATGIQLAADNDFQSNGQLVSTLTVCGGFGVDPNAPCGGGGQYTACGCDSGGTITIAPAGCGDSTCSTGHWVVRVWVKASGTFTPLFNYPGISNSITIVRTCILRVAQD
jgi:Flp pilus assembly protein TadG